MRRNTKTRRPWPPPIRYSLDRATHILLRAIVRRQNGEHEALTKVRREFLQIAAKVGPEFPKPIAGGLRTTLPNATYAGASSAIRTDMGRLFGRDFIFPDLIGVEPRGQA
jgi:hypothetical protein